MYRKGRETDCEQVYELICEMEAKRLPYGRFREIFLRQLGEKHRYCLIREEGGRVAGVLNLRFEEQLHHAGPIAEIMEFVVAPGLRGRGVGKEMLAEAGALATERGCAQLEVACNQLRRDTHRFYGREGMGNFHFKFSRRLDGTDTQENRLGR